MYAEGGPHDRLGPGVELDLVVTRAALLKESLGAEQVAEAGVFLVPRDILAGEFFPLILSDDNQPEAVAIATGRQCQHDVHLLVGAPEAVAVSPLVVVQFRGCAKRLGRVDLDFTLDGSKGRDELIAHAVGGLGQAGVRVLLGGGALRPDPRPGRLRRGVYRRAVRNADERGCHRHVGLVACPYVRPVSGDERRPVTVGRVDRVAAGLAVGRCGVGAHRADEYCLDLRELLELLGRGGGIRPQRDLQIAFVHQRFEVIAIEDAVGSVGHELGGDPVGYDFARAFPSGLVAKRGDGDGLEVRGVEAGHLNDPELFAAAAHQDADQQGRQEKAGCYGSSDVISTHLHVPVFAGMSNVPARLSKGSCRTSSVRRRHDAGGAV